MNFGGFLGLLIGISIWVVVIVAVLLAIFSKDDKNCKQ